PARKLFLEAEDLRLAGVDPQDYLMRFEEMIREYPQSDYAPKSEYVIAWTYENVLQDSVMAYSMYKRLAERYPDSEYGQIAAEKLNSSR
ncbi:MAG TPA: tetratricopeptide repeat protein, partial [Candidatus Latescibacteria bacterium]|nr:tetratricopeptide repeat protein [Candidatus Latescibacterota bacterium]